MNAAPPRPSWPVAEKPAPTMTWAEMAHAEGHRKGLPPSIEAKTQEDLARAIGQKHRKAIAEFLAEKGEATVEEIANHIGCSARATRTKLSPMRRRHREVDCKRQRKKEKAPYLWYLTPRAKK